MLAGFWSMEEEYPWQQHLIQARAMMLAGFAPHKVKEKLSLIVQFASEQCMLGSIIDQPVTEQCPSPEVSESDPQNTTDKQSQVTEFISRIMSPPQIVITTSDTDKYVQLVSDLYLTGLEYNKLSAHKMALKCFSQAVDMLVTLTHHQQGHADLLQEIAMALIRTDHFLHCKGSSSGHRMDVNRDVGVASHCVYSLHFMVDIVEMVLSVEADMFSRIWLVAKMVDHIVACVKEMPPHLDVMQRLRAAKVATSWHQKMLCDVRADDECYQLLEGALTCWKQLPTGSQPLDQMELVVDSYSIIICAQIHHDDLTCYNGGLSDLLDLHDTLCHLGCTTSIIPRQVSHMIILALERGATVDNTTFTLLQKVMDLLKSETATSDPDHDQVSQQALCSWLLDHWWTLGNIYYSDKKYEKAMVVYENLLELALNNEDVRPISPGVTRTRLLALTYTVLGFCNLGLHNIKMAHYFEKALEFKQHISDDNVETIYGSLANIYYIRGAEMEAKADSESSELYGRAEKYFKDSLQLTVRPSAVTFTTYAYYLFTRNRLQECMNVLNRAYRAENITTSIIRFDHSEEVILTDSIREMMGASSGLVLPTVILILYFKCCLLVREGRTTEITDLLTMLRKHICEFPYDENRNCWDVFEADALHANALSTLGYAEMLAGHHDDAITTFSEARVLNSQVAEMNIAKCKSIIQQKRNKCE